MTNEKITQHIKNEIAKLSYEKDGEWFIRIGNCRLDFSQKYKLIGFTNKTVKLAWKNGNEWITMQGRVEKRHDYYALYTDGWQYIEHLELEKVEEVAQ